MEKFALTLKSKNSISEYLAENFTMRYEREIITEILTVIENKDEEKLNWFTGFGDSYRQILMNVNKYRRGLIYGFTEIAIGKYGWFASPKFLHFEEIKLEESSIRIGRGFNDLWSYALNRTYGSSGSSGPLSVFCPPFKSREAALNAAVAEIKADFTKYVGHSDTSNFKPDLIVKTLKAISRAEVSMVQLSLF